MIAGANIRDERGTTLVEMLVGLTAGMVVLMTLTTVIVVTLHGSARVSARVESTQRARLVITQIMEELHSACVAPQIAPIQETSTGTSLAFLHATGTQNAAVAPQPTKTVISLENGILTQTDTATVGGASPNWVFATNSTTRQLLTKVAPISPSTSIFKYYKYTNGSLVEIPASTAIGKEAAGLAIQVKVALTANPTRTPVADAGADTAIQDRAVLRLTPPSFNEGASALPCQ